MHKLESKINDLFKRDDDKHKMAKRAGKKYKNAKCVSYEENNSN